MDLEKLAKAIFKAVETDLRDRRGIHDEWDACDEDIQEEIRKTNEENIVKVLKKHGVK